MTLGDFRPDLAGVLCNYKKYNELKSERPSTNMERELEAYCFVH